MKKLGSPSRCTDTQRYKVSLIQKKTMRKYQLLAIESEKDLAKAQKFNHGKSRY